MPATFKVKMITEAKVIRGYITQQMQAQRMRLLRELFVAGEKCVNDARLSGSYTDRTGNLRGSVGYAVVDRGQLLTAGGFQQVKNGKEGPPTGKAYLEELIKEQQGLVMGPTLIVVAGMNYAKYVTDRGYNVLVSAEMLAEKLIREIQLKMQ